MPLYISLMSLTEQGIKNIKDAPERAKQGFKGKISQSLADHRHACLRLNLAFILFSES